jgi:hypothetical protein
MMQVKCVLPLDRQQSNNTADGFDALHLLIIMLPIKP